MDTEFARKYLNGEVSISDDSQPTETANDTVPSDTSPTGDDGNSQVETQTETQTDTANPNDDKPADQSSDTPDEGDKDKTASKPHDGKKQPRMFSQEKANEAFLKQKRKYQQRVTNLQNEVDSLKAQLAKYNSVDLDKLKDDPDKLMDFKIAKGIASKRLEDLQNQRQAAEDEYNEEEAERINQERINNCFSDETEKAHYQTLMKNGAEKFVNFLNTYDPEHAVLQFLDDSDVSPLMIKVLMTNPDVLKNIISKRGPMNKAIELKQLENRIKLDRKLRSVKVPNSSVTTPVDKKLPSTGSQTSNNPKGGSEVRDRNYWRNYLATHS